MILFLRLISRKRGLHFRFRPQIEKYQLKRALKEWSFIELFQGREAFCFFQQKFLNLLSYQTILFLIEIANFLLKYLRSFIFTCFFLSIKIH